MNGFREYVEDKVREIFGCSIFSLERLPGDASDRKFFRINIKDGDSIVLMKLKEPILHGLDFINILMYLNECKVAVPKLYHYDERKGVLFLEDLGDETFEEKVKGKDRKVYIEYYKKAIDVLIDMQIKTYRFKGISCIAHTRAFDVEKFMWEFNFFLRYVIEVYRKERISKRDSEILNKYFLEISHILAKEPRYFTHRDYHSRNLMIHNDEIKMVDFQDARLGLCQYDLASLLRDSYVVLEEDLLEEMIRYYIAKKGLLEGIEIDMVSFKKVFDYMCLERNMKACGSFAYLNFEKHNPRYLQYIPDTLCYIKNNLERHKELYPLYKILKRYLNFEALFAVT